MFSFSTTLEQGCTILLPEDNYAPDFSSNPNESHIQLIKVFGITRNVCQG